MSRGISSANRSNFARLSGNEAPTKVPLGGEPVMRAAVQGNVVEARGTAPGVRLLVMKLEQAGFPATLAASISEGAAPPVPLPNSPPERGGNVPTLLRWIRCFGTCALGGLGLGRRRLGVLGRRWLGTCCRLRRNSPVPYRLGRRRPSTCRCRHHRRWRRGLEPGGARCWQSTIAAGAFSAGAGSYRGKR